MKGSGKVIVAAVVSFVFMAGCVTPGVLTRVQTLDKGEISGGLYSGLYGTGIQGRIGVAKNLELGLMYTNNFKADNNNYQSLVLDGKYKFSDNFAVQLTGLSALTEATSVIELNAIFNKKSEESRTYYGLGIAIPHLDIATTLGNFTWDRPTPQFFFGYAPKLSDKMSLVMEIDYNVVTLIPFGSVGVGYNFK
jgi:hypothetical protein